MWNHGFLLRSIKSSSVGGVLWEGLTLKLWRGPKGAEIAFDHCARRVNLRRSTLAGDSLRDMGAMRQARKAYRIGTKAHGDDVSAGGGRVEQGVEAVRVRRVMGRRWQSQRLVLLGVPRRRQPRILRSPLV